MKLMTALCPLVLLVFSACAHNPRPESPEQRAERQAQSLQAQQDAQDPARSVGYDSRQDEVGDTREPSQPQQQAGADATAREELRAQAAATRATLRSLRSANTPVAGGLTGGLLQ